MKEGRSRVPVRTGYMYSGHTYTPFWLFFLFSTGLQEEGRVEGARVKAGF